MASKFLTEKRVLMSIIEKTKKLLKTSIEILAERYPKGPEAILERYIEELQDALESSVASIKALKIEASRLEKRIKQLKADEVMWLKKAQSALENLKDEELAKEALRRKKQVIAESRELEEIVYSHHQDIEVMENSLKQLEEKLKETKLKKEKFTARLVSDKTREHIKGKVSGLSMQEGLEEVEEQLLALNARAGVLNDMKLLSVKDLTSTYSELEEDVEEELEKLKKECKRE